MKKLHQNNPVFIHQTVAEYLVVKWLMDNVFGEEAENVASAKDFYTEIVTKSNPNLQILFDSVICKDLALHSAVIKGDFASVRDFCNNNNGNIEEVDLCGRNCLHLAASHCFREENYEILAFLVNCMLLNKRCAFHRRDTYMTWTWLDYLKFKNPKYLRNARELGAVAALKLHRNRPNLGFDTKSFLKENYTYYDIFAIEETIDCGCLDIVCELMQWYCNYDRRFYIFFRLCENLYDIQEDKYIQFYSDWKFKFTALNVACLYGHLQTVEQLMQLGTDVIVTDNGGMTPLHYAIAGRSSKVVSKLLEHENIKMQFDNNTCKYLQFAAIYSNSEIFEMFLNEANGSVNIDAEDSDGRTSFFLAAQAENLDILRFLSNKKVNVEKRNKRGDTALHRACVFRQDNIVRYLVQKYPHLKYLRNEDNKTPFDVADERIRAILDGNETGVVFEEDTDFAIPPILTRAATHERLNFRQHDEDRPLSVVANGNIDALKLLVNNGLQIEDVNEPLLHVAIENGNTDIINFLLDEKIDINLPDKFRRSALHIAARKGNIEITKRLLQVEGIDLNKVTIFNESALLMAVKHNKLEIVKLLVDAGINVNTVNYSRESVLHYAARMNEIEIVEVLLAKEDVNINIVNEFDETALHVVIRKGFTNIALLLVNSNIDYHLKNYSGKSALSVAVWKRNVSVTELILKKHLDISSNYQYTAFIDDIIDSENWDIIKLLVKHGLSVIPINIK